MGPEYCFSLVETLVDELRKRKANIAENRSDRYAIGCSLASELKERGQAFFTRFRLCLRNTMQGNATDNTIDA